jgi:hypothetical protein
MDDASPPRKQPTKLRFIDSMPRALLVLFTIAGVAAVVTALVFIIDPPRSATLPVEQRRPPPRGTLSHDTGRIYPAPLPSVVPAVAPACPAIATTRIKAGTAGVARLRAVLADLCGLSHGGVSADLTLAIRGLRGATLQFAGFQRAGVESTVDFATKTIWLNLKFSQESMDVELVAPVVVHEGWHLAHPNDAVTAGQELGARTAEVDACRQLINIDKWPRWCQDGRALTELPAARAIALLVSAGYPR